MDIINTESLISFLEDYIGYSLNSFPDKTKISISSLDGGPTFFIDAVNCAIYYHLPSVIETKECVKIITDLKKDNEFEAKNKLYEILLECHGEIKRVRKYRFPVDEDEFIQLLDSVSDLRKRDIQKIVDSQFNSSIKI